MNKLIELNSRYNFKIEEFGIYYKITSRFDTWFIRQYDNYNYKIMLFHGNKMGKCTMHKQNLCDNIEHLFNYIKSHDSKLFIKDGVVA